ncbi:hypothetical protein BP5796_04534 [Coleophoma crateriformis]|uniref:3beta-hydroxysteroid 3-dehydrogenase n=1 Tax=Coleophoma crateriformis TaxID=565419 RepID=A0A3D8S9U4_9HELO|nr:hypothetical protein BP5796_04534 [Coleophoma crateriformis]
MAGITKVKETTSQGTVLITGANGSLGLSLVQQLLEQYPSYSAILTVRDISDRDPNTEALRKLLSRFPAANATIEVLDLASLSNVRAFAEDVASRVSTGKIPPIAAIVCNAFAWSLVGMKHSSDDYELGFQVSHLSHFILVLKLLDAMNKSTGRIVLLGSVVHDGAEKFGAKFPDDLEKVIKPPSDKPGEEFAQGFQRYANSKLANVMFMLTLNKRLAKDPSLKGITAVAVNPGDMPTSRAFQHVPFAFRMVLKIAACLLPLFQYFTSLTTTKSAAINLMAMSVGPDASGSRGYFEGQKPVQSSKDSQDKGLRERVWKACEKWCGLKQSETVLNIGEGEY